VFLYTDLGGGHKGVVHIMGLSPGDFCSFLNVFGPQDLCWDCQAGFYFQSSLGCKAVVLCIHIKESGLRTF
jgi:hypothetical protein